MTARVNRSSGLTWVIGVLIGISIGFLLAVLPLVGLMWASARRRDDASHSSWPRHNGGTNLAGDYTWQPALELGG